MKINRRTATGWGRRVVNHAPMHCDVCSAKLWQGPGGIVYCNEVHTDEEAENAQGA